MAQVTLTAGTDDLRPAHAVAGVDARLDVALVENVEEARPARPRVELLVGMEQFVATAGAGEHAFVLDVQQVAAEPRLGARLPEDFVLLVGQYLLPLLLSLRNSAFLFAHDLDASYELDTYNSAVIVQSTDKTAARRRLRGRSVFPARRNKRQAYLSMG